MTVERPLVTPTDGIVAATGTRRRLGVLAGLGGLAGAAFLAKHGLSPENLVLAFGTMLIVAAAVCDALTGTIPNAFSLAGISAILAASAFLPGIDARRALLGLVAGGGVLLALGVGLSLLLGKDALGGGDVKLMALIGAVVGWQAVFPVLFWSACLALLWWVTVPWTRGGALRRSVYFGPWMGAAAVLHLLLG